MKKENPPFSPQERLLADLMEVKSPEKLKSVPEDLENSMSAALKTLPENQEKYLRMRYWGGLSCMQIAEQERVTRSAVHASIHRAMENLRKNENLFRLLHGADMEKRLHAIREKWWNRAEKENRQLEERVEELHACACRAERLEKMKAMRDRLDREIEKETRETVKTPFISTGMPHRAASALETNGIRCLEQLLEYSAENLKHIGIGKTDLEQIREFLYIRGLRLKPEEKGKQSCGQDARIAQLALSKRCRRICREAGIRTLGELSEWSRESLKALPGAGEKTLAEMEHVLRKERMEMRTETENRKVVTL